MDRLTLSRRMSLAHGRIGIAIRRLGRLGGMRALSRDVLDAGKPYKDPELIRLYESEAMGEFLDALSDKLKDLMSDDEEEEAPAVDGESKPEEPETAVDSEDGSEDAGEPETVRIDAQSVSEPSTARSTSTRRRVSSTPRNAGRQLPPPSID